MKDVLHRLFGSRVPEHVGSQRVYLANVALVERFEGCDITVGDPLRKRGVARWRLSARGHRLPTLTPEDASG
jgi:hypothetical protein